MNNLVGISIEQAERELIKNTLKLTEEIASRRQKSSGSGSGRCIGRSRNMICKSEWSGKSFCHERG